MIQLRNYQRNIYVDSYRPSGYAHQGTKQTYRSHTQSSQFFRLGSCCSVITLFVLQCAAEKIIRQRSAGITKVVCDHDNRHGKSCLFSSYGIVDAERTGVFFNDLCASQYGTLLSAGYTG